MKASHPAAGNREVGPPAVPNLAVVIGWGGSLGGGLLWRLLSGDEIGAGPGGSGVLEVHRIGL